MAFIEHHIGSKDLISWGKETTFGSPVSADIYLGDNARCEPRDTKVFHEVLNSGSTTKMVTYHRGVDNYSGTLTFTPQDWKILVAVFGDSSDVDIGGGKYSHTFANDVIVPTITLQHAHRATTDHVKTYTSAKINRFTINFNQGGAGAGAEGGFIECAAEFQAKVGAAGTATTGATNNDKEPFKFRQTQLKVNNSIVAEVIGGTIVIENGQEFPRYADYAGTYYIGEPIDIVQRIYGNFTYNLKDDTLYDLYAAGAAINNCSLVFYRGANDDLTLTFTNFYMTGCNEVTRLADVDRGNAVFRLESCVAVAKDTYATYP